ncbi:hypothetical protein M422DRAFT_246485 [Sphaerobolus stellatus SS14]|nr:hypothetical protein M422DRAFT_246485 [Sphaerobolus stellatus SS14]
MSSPVSSSFMPMPSMPKDSSTHPYAIKTSSSSILTRSNSSSNKSADSHHHYTPPVPISPKSSKTRYVPRKHAYSPSKDKSILNTIPAPPPVPMPHFVSGFISDGEGVPPTPPLTVRVKQRHESLPSMAAHDRTASEIEVDSLPNNPKEWTPADLATYLSSSLRLKSGGKLPVPVSRDISTFVVKNHLSGRTFMRMKRQDYDHLELNALWKDALFDASRTLRQGMVHDRVMGSLKRAKVSRGDLEVLKAEWEDEDEEDEEQDVQALKRVRGKLGGANSGAELKKTLGRSALRPGRVRATVQTFERSASGSDAGASGSEASASGNEFDGDEVLKFITDDNAQLVAEPEELPLPALTSHESASSEDSSSNSSNSDSAFLPSLPHLDEFSPSSESSTSRSILVTPNDTEPTIEDLLNSLPPSAYQAQPRSWGAKAWEDELEVGANDVMHATARKISLEDLNEKPLPRVPDFEEDVGGETMHEVGLKGLFQDATNKEVDPPAPSSSGDADLREEELQWQEEEEVKDQDDTFPAQVQDQLQDQDQDHDELPEIPEILEIIEEEPEYLLSQVPVSQVLQHFEDVALRAVVEEEDDIGIGSNDSDVDAPLPPVPQIRETSEIGVETDAESELESEVLLSTSSVAVSTEPEAEALILPQTQTIHIPVPVPIQVSVPIPASIYTMLDSLRERIERLEERVSVLEERVRVKDALMEAEIGFQNEIDIGDGDEEARSQLNSLDSKGVGNNEVVVKEEVVGVEDGEDGGYEAELDESPIPTTTKDLVPSSSSSAPTAKRTHKDPTLRDLPSYMLLLGVGVVAITMRAVLGRVLLGRRK